MNTAQERSAAAATTDRTAVPPSWRIFMAPARYVQGAGVLRSLSDWVGRHGQAPLLLIDVGIAARVHERLSAQLRALPARSRLSEFTGEVTREHIDELAGLARTGRHDLVVGIGGGKALDAAKGVALRLGTPFIAVPTIASTDAPAARGLVVYNADRSWGTVEEMPLNPVCVLVDTQWIAQAPRRFLAAGIGDAISKKFEAEACRDANGLNKHGAPASLTALALADACYRTLRAHGAAAMACFDRGEPDAAFEATVEACLLMSTLAFENAGLSIAHAITIGFPTTRGLSSRLHGEHVAYGTLVQLALQGDSAGVRDLMAFHREVGLPTSLAELGMTAPTRSEIETLARACFTSPRPRNHRDASSEKALADALSAVEAMAQPGAAEGGATASGRS